MYKPDLSPSAAHAGEGKLSLIAIGWLAKAHPYPQGEVSEGFKSKLFGYCVHRVLQTRGFHHCEFCTQPPGFPILAQRDGQEAWLGSAEIRVVYQDKVYAAPTLVYHYVVDHHYRPPDEFVEAVLKGLPPDSAEYGRLREKYRW